MTKRGVPELAIIISLSSGLELSVLREILRVARITSLSTRKCQQQQHLSIDALIIIVEGRGVNVILEYSYTIL